MDDLISRKAAIDEIKDFKQGAAEWRDEQEEGSDIWHRADSAIGTALEIGLRIKKLPSAQPDLQPTCNQLATDCISRKAAIDAFEPWLKVSGYSEGELNMLKAVLYELRFLPSAQPELIEKTAYIRGFEQGRTQGMIDAQGGKK